MENQLFNNFPNLFTRNSLVDPSRIEIGRFTVFRLFSASGVSRDYRAGTQGMEIVEKVQVKTVAGKC